MWLAGLIAFATNGCPLERDYFNSLREWEGSIYPVERLEPHWIERLELKEKEKVLFFDRPKEKPATRLRKVSVPIVEPSGYRGHRRRRRASPFLKGDF